MASRERSKSPNPPASPSLLSSSSPNIGKATSKKSSPATNRKSVKLDVPTSFTIDVNQIASARNKFKHVEKGTPDGSLSASNASTDSSSSSSSSSSSIVTVSSPEKQGSLRILREAEWDSKWCVLKEGRLYIFPSAKVPIPDTILSLNGSRVGDKKQAGEFCFQVTTQSGETWIFSADDELEYITWIVNLRGATFYLRISTYVVESPPREPVTSPKQSGPSPSPSYSLQTSASSPTVSSTSPSGSPQIPRIETTPASPSPSRKVVPASKSPNFVLPAPVVDVKPTFRNSTDISKLPSRIQAIDINGPNPSPLSHSTGQVDKFSSYRRSADISKLSKENYAPLSDAISAAYRKSVDVSKLSHSAHVLSPTASPPNLFSSAEIIPSEKELEEAKGGRRGMLGVPGGMFSKWKQRWVVLANDSLSVYKHEEDEDKKEPVHNFELIFCQPKVVKSEKGKYVFEIHAPGRTIQFGAPSSVDLLDWIHAIQETQTTLMQSYLQYNLNSKGDDGEDGEDKEQLEIELEKSKKKLANIMKSNGNEICVDCGAADPIWASINWGVFICIECSGVHRQMGTHISKVRSVTMDKWDNDVLEFMENNGNARVNAELEHTITPNFTKITPASSRQEREAYIKAKYEDKLFSKKAEQES